MGVQIEMQSAIEILKKHGIEKGGRVQKYIDKEVVSRCDKYVPMRSGLLKRAVGTVFGSGSVRYSLPYAKNQYYNNAGRGKEGTENKGLRGRLWFERMKAVHREAILSGAARLAGAKGRRR